MTIDIVLGLAGGQGGLESVLTLVTEGLRQRGHTPRLFQARRSPLPDWERDLPMRYYDPTAFGYPPHFPEEPEYLRWTLGYRSLIETLGLPDAILATHTPIFSLITRLAVGLSPKAPPVISWLHGPAEAYGETWPLRFADAHLAISEGVGKSLGDALGDCPVHYVGNPIAMDVPRIDRPKEGSEFVFIGRLEPQKRLDRLLRVLSRVRGSWHLTVVGDGSLAASMRELAASLGISGRISWLGWLGEPWQAIREASALLLSSDYEGFGLVLAEALARGIPVVSTNIAGPSDIVRPPSNGWLVGTEDERGFARRLSEICSGELPLPDALACRESVRDFAPDRVVGRILDAIAYVRAFRLGA